MALTSRGWLGWLGWLDAARPALSASVPAALPLNLLSNTRSRVPKIAAGHAWPHVKLATLGHTRTRLAPAACARSLYVPTSAGSISPFFAFFHLCHLSLLCIFFTSVVVEKLFQIKIARPDRSHIDSPFCMNPSRLAELSLCAGVGCVCPKKMSVRVRASWRGGGRRSSLIASLEKEYGRCFG